jgi:hypothetical protein
MKQWNVRVDGRNDWIASNSFIFRDGFEDYTAYETIIERDYINLGVIAIVEHII